MPTMPVGLAQNTPGQRSLFLKQVPAAAACDELKTPPAPASFADIFVPQIRVVAYELSHDLNARGILHDRKSHPMMAE